MTFTEINTRRVYVSTPRVDTERVESHAMKTVGERIRQARDERRMSQGELASRVGFKHQSAIGNLETRSTGRGGFKLPHIAEALDVPLEWLLNGPDTDKVPTAAPPRTASAYETRPRYGDSEETTRAIEILRRLPAPQVTEALAFLEYLGAKKATRSKVGAGSTVPAPSKRAA